MSVATPSLPSALRLHQLGHSHFPLLLAYVSRHILPSRFTYAIYDVLTPHLGCDALTSLLLTYVSCDTLTPLLVHVSCDALTSLLSLPMSFATFQYLSSPVSVATFSLSP